MHLKFSTLFAASTTAGSIFVSSCHQACTQAFLRAKRTAHRYLSMATDQCFAKGEFVETANEFGLPAYETNDSRIRIENEADPEVFGLIKTRSDIVEKIAAVRNEQMLHGNSALLDRKWENEKVDTHNSITVLQFNTLAEGLSAGPDQKRPFRSDSTSKQTGDKDVYGGFDAIPEPSVVLDFEIRRWRLLEVMLGPNADLPFDLLALQEVDRFYGFFAPALQMFGYKGAFTPKRDSPGCRTGWYSDGCCLFWKEDMFDLLSMTRYKYRVGTQVYMIAILRHKPTKKVFIVAVTHLKAQASAANELVRSHQAEELLEYVAKEIELAIARYADPNPGVLIAGDFNTEPGSLKRTQTISKFLGSTGKLLLSSTYALDDPTLFTTWKIRSGLEVKRMIDYIFFGGPLSCINRLLLPTEDEIGTKKLPSLRFPSDHVHIAAQLEIHSPI